MSDCFRGKAALEFLPHFVTGERDDRGLERDELRRSLLCRRRRRRWLLCGRGGRDRERRARG